MTIDQYLNSLTIDFSVKGQSQTIEDVHEDLHINIEGGTTVLSCPNCDCQWTLHLSYNDDLGDHFSLEQISGEDQLMCDIEDDED